MQVVCITGILHTPVNLSNAIYCFIVNFNIMERIKTPIWILWEDIIHALIFSLGAPCAQALLQLNFYSAIASI